MRKLIVALVAVSFVLETTVAFAAPKTPVEPTGAVRAKQYAKVVADCQKRFSGQSRDVVAEWGGHYGRTGWWCVHRRN